ncbi:MAG: hypothetical protein IPK65_13945 [Gammaproteobacteria bacterium]|nr:hypothetical protein [Gammaproteobacteria bacterium]
MQELSRIYALITVTLAGEGAIGTFAVLPLLAIYPGVTGFLGWDPLTSMIGRYARRRRSIPSFAATAARTS